MLSRSLVSRLRRLSVAVLLLSPLAARAIPENTAATAQDALDRLLQNSGGQLNHVANPGNAYTLLRAQGTLPLLQDDFSAAPLERALNFLSLNGVALGVQDALSELSLKRISTDGSGNQHVHLDQTHDGLPVFGARIVVHMNRNGIYGVNGVFVPGLAGAKKTPDVSYDILRSNALLVVQKQHPGSALSIESSRLMYYRPSLLDEGLSKKTSLAYEAMVSNGTGGGIRERVILDAATGVLLNRIDEIHTLLNRAIHTPNIGTAPVVTEGSALAPDDPPLINDDRGSMSSRVPPAPPGPLSNLYIFAGGTYALYKNMFGREGYDDGARPPEEQVQHSVYLVNDQCPNAYWDGTSTNYCPAFDADDVVSHEWSHAYTEYTHGLVYQYQSGALNESYSDIFGETYDLTNGIEGPLGVTLTEGEYFENGGSRWVVGEDLSEALAGVLLRDMWDPDNFGANAPLLGIQILSTPSPGSVISSPNYYCGPSQSTLVHTDSGIPNHAYAMLVDGKEFNGVTVPGIGITKAAHIYFQAETHYQTPTTNFAQHAEALESACHDLIGAELNDATGAVSGEHITAADCDAVHATTVATELRESVVDLCGYEPLLRPEADTPAICPSGESEIADFSENWESSSEFPSGWTVTNNFTGDSPRHDPWIISSELPAPHTGHAAYAKDEPKGGGAAGSGDDLSGSTLLESPEITLTNDASFFKFTHLVQTELDFDGGNLKYSLNGGAFGLVPAGAISFNPYNTTLLAPADNTNPIAGEAAFSGTDQGEGYGTWGTTLVDLSSLGAKSGDKIRFRFDYGQDLASGNLGWFVDDMVLGHCAVSAPEPPPVTPEPPPSRPTTGRTSRFGGAFGLSLLLPLLGLGLARRRRA